MQPKFLDLPCRSLPVEEVEIGGSVLRRYTHWTIALPTGDVNMFSPSCIPDREEYLLTVREAGYGEDWLLYALEHDKTHMWLAKELGWPYSQAIYDGVQGIGLDQISERTSYEEDLTNWIQVWYNTGFLHERLNELFGDRLDWLRQELQQLYQR